MDTDFQTLLYEANTKKAEIHEIGNKCTVKGKHKGKIENFKYEENHVWNLDMTKGQENLHIPLDLAGRLVILIPWGWFPPSVVSVFSLPTDPCDLDLPDLTCDPEDGNLQRLALWLLQKKIDNCEIIWYTQ